MVTHMFTCTVQPGRSHVQEEHRLCCVLSYKQPEQYAGWGSNFNLSFMMNQNLHPPSEQYVKWGSNINLSSKGIKLCHSL